MNRLFSACQPDLMYLPNLLLFKLAEEGAQILIEVFLILMAINNKKRNRDGLGWWL
jgi:hypothetical protein